MTSTAPSQIVIDRLNEQIDNNAVMLYMKGTPEFPQCGFSSVVVRVLDVLGVEYETENVLADMSVREGIKAFSDWPTIPQLYIKGEFVGGCDIVREMFESGELKTLLKENNLIAD